MKTEILLINGTKTIVNGKQYREHFCIYWSELWDWTISHINTGRSIIGGIPSFVLAMEVVDGIIEILNDWDFDDPSQVCCEKAELIRAHLAFICDVMYSVEVNDDDIE